MGTGANVLELFLSMDTGANVLGLFFFQWERELMF